ncbi:MAG: hypothetical protein ACYS8I_00990 [Planctomycetota bacterium]|jgi:uncharacterized protein (TIGR03546 family)
MILPRPIRKFIAVFRGGVSPVLIVLSATLGLWLGIVPGWSGFHTVMLILALLLNINVGLFLLLAAVGRMLCLAAAPVLFHIGLAVHDYLPVLLHLLSSVPVLGITDFNRYSVVGAIVIGPVIGCALGLILARSVIGFRRRLVKFEERSEKFQKWYSKRWVYYLDRVIIGKRTKDAKSLFTVKTKYIRKAGVVVAVFVLAVSAVVISFIKDDVVKDHASTAMTQANGAEVNLDSVDLSVLKTAVSVSGIQVTDAEKPQNNQLAIEKIAADASLYNLLLGKLVMDNVEVSNVRFNEKRQAPGEVIDADKRWKIPVGDPRDLPADIEKLEGYLKDAKAAKKWLQRISKWLPGPEKVMGARMDQVPQKYLHYLQARAVTPPSPRILAKKIQLDKVQIPSQLFGNSKLLLRNISDSAHTADLPVTLEMKSYDTPASVDITFDYASPEQAPPVLGKFAGFDLKKIQAGLSRKSRLILESGTASGSFDGKVTNQFIDLTIDVIVSDMKASSRGGGIWGLDAKTSSEALKVLENLNTTIRVVGPVTEPSLEFDIKGLQENLKEALIKAGKDRLAQEIDKQIDKALDDKLPDEIKDVLKKPGGLLDGLDGILRQNDDKK